MLRTGKTLVAACMVMFSGALLAQEPLDGAYQKTIVKEKEVIPYDFLREADIFWQKRIWRTIDVREKMNLPFAYPGQPLIDIIHTAAKNGELTVYDNSVLNADQFKQVLSVEDVKKLGSSTDTSTVVNPVTLEEETKIIHNDFTADKVHKYYLKEDWMFNEQTSAMTVRILGLAPVMDDLDQNGNYRADRTMYWVYYPDLRPILVKYEVFNSGNDADRLTWEDIFEARMFQSTIFKESNVFDRRISQYMSGPDILLEADKIKNDMFNWEHDLWSY